MSEREFDVVVAGLGPGGEYVATKLAEAGVAVAAVEENLVGGECRYWGCNPSKMMIRAGSLLAEGRRIPGMAGASVISPDWAPYGTWPSCPAILLLCVVSVTARHPVAPTAAGRRRGGARCGGR